MAEVDQQAEAKVGSSQIVMQLGSIPVGYLGHGLDFHDDQVKAKKVWLISLLENSPLVAQSELGLRLEWYPS